MTNFIFANTWEENQEAFKTRKLAIIPVGSSEQHGPTLPVGTDWIVAEYLAKMVGDCGDFCDDAYRPRHCEVRGGRYLSEPVHA